MAGETLTANTSINILVKWSGKEYEVNEVCLDNTVGQLKEKIFSLTDVRPERQKLLNLKFKGRMAADELYLSNLSLKPGVKIMMMGSREETIAETAKIPEDMPEVKSDLDGSSSKTELWSKTSESFRIKVDERVRTLKVNILNLPRPEKKLLVLDMDYTLYDHKSTAETGAELLRPYTNQFLQTVYEHYDLIIWSATDMKAIVSKMKVLGLANNPNYKFVCYFDSMATIPVSTSLGMKRVKPLHVIWGMRLWHYNEKNTIMVDDISRNFMTNRRNGLRVRPFKNAHRSRDTDNELLRLAAYFKAIAGVKDVKIPNHSKWEKYLKDHNLDPVQGPD